LENLETLAHEVRLAELPAAIEQMLAAKATGRVLVNLA
jgi:hypothetical protein